MVDSRTLTRRDLLRAGALAFAATASPLPAQSRRPNVLILFPDQMRAQAMGVMGNPDVKTPNIDRLASQGLLLRHTYANTPVCCPARANILTGRYAHRNGMIANDLRLRESEVTIAEVLGRAGYRTGFIGKWHLDGGPRLPGFVPPGERRQGFEFWAANECSHSHFDTQYFRDSPEPIPIRKFEPEVWTDLALEFLEACAKDSRPFFLQVAMGPPHNPYKAPEKYRKMYDPAKLTMRDNWREGTGVPGREDLAEYYGMITAVDDQAGRVMAALDRLKLAQDTVVLFSSDHGDMFGSQGTILKRKPWEESIGVPGIVRYPRRTEAGRRTDALFTHVDFAPTLLGLCGITAPSSMQGTDLSPLILGRTEDGPDSAFFQIFGPFSGGRVAEGWRGVRTKRYMYARTKSRPWVLYDVEKDPFELNDLVEDPASADLLRRMDDGLAQWMRRTGDTWDNDWTDLVEDNGRLYRHETFYTLEDYRKWAAEHPDKVR